MKALDRARGVLDRLGEPDPDRPSSLRVLRGYGPLAVLALVLVLMSAFVPTTEPNVVQVAGDATGGGGPTAAGPAAGPGAQTTTGGTTSDGATAAGDDEAGETALPPGETAPCSDGREFQVPGDTYSPPCIEFSGNNGGATHRGVTAENVEVAFRVLDEPGFQEALAQLSGADISDTPEDVKRTVTALAEYFNRNFQFYGREIDINFYDGKGSSTEEILGGGQEEAQQDARHVARELEAFAELNASTPPFADALTREEVVNFGAPYMSRKWFVDRAPYAWSLAIDGSIVVETVAEYALKRLYDKPARWAGGNLKDQPRKFGTIAPENTWYQESVDDGEAILREGGIPEDELPFRQKYQLNLATMSSQATNLIAKFKDEGVTSIFTGFDPVMAIFLTGKAIEQDYHPEWLVVGVAVQDVDIIAQLFDQQSWARAFGVSYLSEFQPQRASYGYNAYKQIRDDEPAFVVDVIYYQMYMLALGLHMAGPDLTPQTYAQGMYNYPGGTGPIGLMLYGPDDYTPPNDGREIYWDPEAISPQNNEPGAYIETDPGARFRRGEWPEGEPQVFR